MRGGRSVYITWSGGEIQIRGDRPYDRGLFVSGDGIEGWDSVPTSKVSMTEMQTGDGAHRVSDRDVLYSARTVTINITAHGLDRSEVVSLKDSIARACHEIVTIRVVDADSDTYCKGYIQPQYEAEWFREWSQGSITVVCPDPRRLSSNVNRVQLMPVGSMRGGLSYGSGGGLVYDLDYGSSPEVLQNVATLTNSGSSTAYPRITVNGKMDAGLRFDWDGGSVQFDYPVGDVPVAFDCLTRTAYMAIGGLDVSRYLSSRGFPEISPNGSVTVSMQGTGTGWATIEWNDTFI